MKKNTQKEQMPKGVYGKEVNGSNPLEWNLRSTICAQLRSAGYYCDMDCFSDQSGSWIAVYKADNNPSKPVAGKRLSMSISFNYEGSVITGIRMFEETFHLTSSDTNKIF